MLYERAWVLRIIDIGNSFLVFLQHESIKMGDFITYEKIPEKAVLIAVASKQQGRERTEEYLDELAFLLETVHPFFRICNFGSREYEHLQCGDDIRPT